MSCPLPSKAHPLLRSYIQHPWTKAARTSPAARRWLDKHGYITPHFSWSSYACQDGTPVPAHLKHNAIRFHWRLEILRHRMGDVPMSVDGPYRTPARNKAVGGASNSQHMYADAGDFFAAQVDRWVKQSKTLHSRQDVLRLANKTFYNGGVGNETSGTLHLDSRGYKARFITW
jgi:hypothetical protein